MGGCASRRSSAHGYFNGRPNIGYRPSAAATRRRAIARNPSAQPYGLPMP